jgi:RHS repeat-associated protein
MKKYYFTLLFLGFIFFVKAQDLGGTPVQGIIPIKRLSSSKETTVDSNSKTSKTSKTSATAKTAAVTTTPAPTGTSQEVGITEGQLSVSLSGGASYAIPIAVPPGINGVVPQVGLVYNSQSGNGMAGYGWNISGVSAITRIPRTKFHDDVVGGVNLDANDRFALDGQRLILKTGTPYGTAGTTYETENFSNIKITAVGVSLLGANYGPASFKVEYPDGSKAEYGATNDSRSITTWGITYWENPQGVRISYNYILANNNLNIEFIKYGSTGTNTAINQIQFVYVPRQRPEQSYIVGQSILMNTILKEIKTIGNGVGFRNYVLEPEPTTLGYTKLKSITEKSGDVTKSYNPTVFNYGGATNSGTFDVNPNKPTISLSNINANNAATVVADFDGDGKNDFIVYPKTGPDAFKKYWIYDDIYGSSLDTGYALNLGDFTDIFATSYLKGDATNGFKLSPGQGWTVAKNNGDNYTFDTWALIPVSPSTGYNHYPTLQYTKTIFFPTENTSDCYNTNTVIFPKEFLSGDFNGDGLTDAIAIDLPLNSMICDYDGTSYSNTIYSQNVYFVDLKKDVNNSATPIGIINEIVTDATNIQVVDFNSDGKSDFMVLTEGKVTVYTLGTTNNLIVLTTYTDAGLKADKPCLLGDYNGDGKTDFVIPQTVGQDSWCFYQATGSSSSTISGFIKTQKAVGTTYYLNSSTETEIGDWRTIKIDITEYNYLANDLNGDGKTDIVRLYNKSFDHYDYYSLGFWGNHKYERSDYTNQGDPIYSSVKLFHNLYTAAVGLNFSFQETEISGIHTYPIPLLTNHTQPNLKLEFSLLTDNTIYTLNSTKDNRLDTRLAAVTTGNGVKESITYKPLVDDYDYDYNLSVYKPVFDKSVYPNTDIAVAPGFQVVSMLEKQSTSIYKKQLFSYTGATSNMEGLGFLGFRASMRTNWFNDDSQIISSLSQFDPNLRGATVANYTYLGLVAPTIAVNTTAPNIPRTSAITISNTRTDNVILQATNSIRFLPGATILPTVGNTFIAQITPNYDANGYGETNTSPPYNLISKSISFYEASLSTTKVYNLKNTQSNTYNILENTSSETITVYDANNNPTESINKIRNGGVGEQTTISTVAYESVSSPYMVGRPATKTQTVTSSGDSMTSKEVYGYGSGTESNLLKTIQKWGNNTSSITEANLYDTFGNITKKTISAAGIADKVTNYKYEPTGRFLEESYDIENLKTSYLYYPNGTLQSETNPYGLTTSYLYDSWFKKTTVTDYLGKIRSFGYVCMNGISTITSTGDPTEGSKSEEVYDELGRKIRSGIKDLQGIMSYKDFKYDIYDRNYSNSEPHTGTASLWNTTTYDVYGRPETVTDFKGNVMSMVYDKLTTTITDGSTLTTKKATKNAMGNMVQMEETPGGIIKYSYFANGNLKETDYATTKITLTQDGWGRKTSLADPAAGNYAYEYNALGEMTKETTPNGTTTYDLDDWGKFETKSIVGPVTDTNTIYTYNTVAEGKLLIKTQYTDNKDASNWITTDYIYDSKKRLEKTIETTGYGAVFTKTITYDAWGRVATETSKAELNGKSSEKVIQNNYKNGFAYKITDTQGSNPKNLWETTKVNERGQLKEALLGNGIGIVNTYDSSNFGYLTTTTHTLTGTTPPVMELTNDFNLQRGNLNWRKNSLFGTIQEDFTYDNQDRLLSYPNKSGAVVNQSYVITNQSYEDDGRIKKNDALGTYNYANTAKKYQNTSVTLSPEAAGYYANREGIFNDSMEDKKGWTIPAPLVYTYDTTEKHFGNNSLKIANTTTAKKVIFSEVWTKIDNTAPTTSYTYSAWVKSDAPQVELALLMKTETETNYYTSLDSKVTNVTNQWVRIEGTFLVPANIKKLSLRLDNNGLGNVWFDDVMIRKTTNTALDNLQIPLAPYYKDHQLNISYNTFKSPVDISEAGVDKLSFVYNDNNDRSVMFYGSLDDNKTLRPNRKYYSADGTMEIKTTPSGTEFVTYLGGDGYSAPVAYKKTFDSAGNAQEQMLYLHRDYQGSILAITNDAGAIVEKRQFDAWGAIIQVQDGNGNVLNGLTILDRGYTGHEHLQSVGLINMNGRLYDPKLHRFLQPDNFVQDPSNTQNYNRYGYVLNNPLKYTDPSGEAGEPCECPGNNYPNYNPDNIKDHKDLADAIKHWVGGWASARNFDEAGTAVGKAARDAVNFIGRNVGSFLGGIFGSNRSAPVTQVMSNANMNIYTPGGSSSFDINNKTFNEYKGVFSAAIAKVSTVTGIVQQVAQNQIISNYKAGGDVLEAMKDFKSLGGLRKVNKVFQRIGYAGLVVDYAQLGSKIYNNQAKTSDYLRTGISTALTLVAISNPVGIIAVGAYGVWDYYYGDEFWKETGIDYN